MADLFTQRRLFMLDAMALIYRAHFALIRSPRFTSGGLCTSAVFGVTNTVFDIINTQKPTHLLVAYDTAEPTFRHEQFPAYKAQRDALPEDIAAQFPIVDRFFEAMNIKVIRSPGFEADDIIGTIAKAADRVGFESFMVTPDKDYTQLVTEHIKLFRPGRQGAEHEVLGVKEVLAEWQIERVDQVIDILGLMGDSSDNIPGVPGYGEKTAQKLIAEYGSIENLIENAGQLKGKMRERIEQFADQALLSKHLVTIKTDVPLDFQFSDFEWTRYDEKNLKQLFMDIEFESLGKRLFGKSFSSATTRAAVIREKREKEIQSRLFDEPVSEKQIEDIPHEYRTLTTKEARGALLAELLQQESVCFDTETTGLDPRTAQALGMSFSIKPHAASYVVCPDDPAMAQAVLEEFRPLFEHESIEKVGHNLKYDAELLRWNGIELKGPLFDTMLAHSMKEPEMLHGMDYLAKLYLGYAPIPISDLIGQKGEQQREMRDVPLPVLAEYACEDADVTLQLAHVMREDIEKAGVARVCYEVECPLIPVLVEMEYEGITLNAEALKAYSIQLSQEIAELEEKIYLAAGRRFNIASPKQLGVVLYEDLQLVANPKKTATGQYSTREDELMRLAGKHPIVANVLDYRNASKLKSTYVDALPDSVNPKTGRLHTRYSQAWTATGRMQSNDPNLQTIPIRKERGREIRAAFVPRNEEYLILSADYSQIELRIMAALSRDQGMIDAFVNKIDIHRATAAKVYKIDLKDVDREKRDKAKMVNFGIIYGISSFGLQQRLNIPRQEATDLIQNYFEKYPGVHAFIQSCIQFAKDNGYVKTVTGRRRYIRDINSQNRSLANTAERLAMNSPIQGTAADMLKLAMIKIHHALKKQGFKTKMLLTVHDEIVFDMYRAEQDEVMPVIAECMKTALPLEVPLEVEMGTGKTWLEAH
jgi:DNA polymerase I